MRRCVVAARGEPDQCIILTVPALSLTLPLPKLLCKQATTAAQDSTVTLSASKAKELGVTRGDVVLVIGRRRRAAYARVAIDKKTKKSGSCGVRPNLAANLRLRQDDKVKVEPLKENSDADDERSGDLLLLQKEPQAIASVTFSPVEDSLQALVASEGGDMLDDAEIQARFVTPYLESGGDALLKQDHMLTLRDENNKKLEFYVSHIQLEGADEAEETEGSVFSDATMSAV